MYIIDVITPVSSADAVLSQPPRRDQSRAIEISSDHPAGPKQAEPAKSPLSESKAIELKHFKDVQTPEPQTLKINDSNQEQVKSEQEHIESSNEQRRKFYQDELTHDELKLNEQREEARKKFFEDLNLYERRQAKLSEIFKRQSELPFIGKHADLTA
jgi:hypothetical protein